MRGSCAVYRLCLGSETPGTGHRVVGHLKKLLRAVLAMQARRVPHINACVHALAARADSELPGWASRGPAVWKAPALPLGGGPYDRSLGVGVPPDSPPKPVSFGFCCSGNTGGVFFSFFLYIYCCESKKNLNNFLNDGRLPGHVDSAAASSALPRASVRR